MLFLMFLVVIELHHFCFFSSLQFSQSTLPPTHQVYFMLLNILTHKTHVCMHARRHVHPQKPESEACVSQGWNQSGLYSDIISHVFSSLAINFEKKKNKNKKHDPFVLNYNWHFFWKLHSSTFWKDILFSISQISWIPSFLL